MIKIKLSLILTLLIASSAPALQAQTTGSASEQRTVDWQDSGASGVIDGTDVYQFLNSGPIIDSTRMEEASRKADSTIKLPSYRRTKNWQEVIDRDRQEREAGIGATYGGAGSVNHYAHYAASTNVNDAGSTEGAINPNGPAGTTNSSNSSPATADGAASPAKKSHKHKHSFASHFKNAIEDAAEFIGFPISDEPPPSEVDAKLSGDLPDGPDPRVYVHEIKAPASADTNQVQVTPVGTDTRRVNVTQPASSPNPLATEAQPPVIIEN